MSLENKVLDLIAKSSNGVTNKMLESANITAGLAELVEIINKLSQQEKIQIFHKGKELVYMVKSQPSKGLSGTDLEEKIIYQLIEKAGNKGIWIRDLRCTSNVAQAQVNKILKNLESKKLIKSVSSVAASKKKVYMLYNIEPDRSVSGGTWYSDQEFDLEFVDVLNQQCYRYLQQAKVIADKMSDPLCRRRASYKSSREICDYINGLNISKVKLSIQDIENILDTLVYDGKIEKDVFDGTAKSYRTARPLITNSQLMRVPCGVCPVHKDCKIGGIVSPTTCPYIKEWLDF